MTTIEKRNKIKNTIESFSNEQLEETMSFIEQIKENDEKRKGYIKDILKKEKNIFERFAK